MASRGRLIVVGGESGSSGSGSRLWWGKWQWQWMGGWVEEGEDRGGQWEG